MNHLYFNIYEFQIEIKSSDLPLKNLKIIQEFSFFSVQTLLAPATQIKISNLPLFAKQGILIGKTRMCEVRQVSFGKRQMIYSYHGRVLAVVYDSSFGGRRQIEIQAHNVEAVDDILYFLINSLAGEHLDATGIMRIHAFSFAGPKKTPLVFGPSGSGKSSLALELLNHQDCHLFSDEITLVNLANLNLRPFPLQISSDSSGAESAGHGKFTYFFKSKAQVPVSKTQVAASGKLTDVYLLQPGVFKHLRFAVEIILGAGLPQMWEYMLRLNNFSTLLKIFKNRIRLLKYLRTLPIHDLNKMDSIAARFSALL